LSGFKFFQRKNLNQPLWNKFYYSTGENERKYYALPVSNEFELGGRRRLP
jgi:hypothetical protein